MNIGICVIATRKYKQFVQPLIEGLDKYFLARHKLTLFLFTDEEGQYFSKIRLSVKQIIIPPYKFPLATLYRYKTFNENSDHFKDMDYLFYTDVDMGYVSEVGQEILVPNLLCVHHPGYYTSKGWGSDNNPRTSLSYLPNEQRRNYYAGGFQGGKTDAYLRACHILDVRIRDDEHRGVMAEWHDETHWNWLLNSGATDLKHQAFGPEYCMVEEMSLRKQWGISHLKPRIIALAKDHKAIRE